MHIIRIKLKAEQLNRTFRNFFYVFLFIFRWVNKREIFFKNWSFIWLWPLMNFPVLTIKNDWSMMLLLIVVVKEM